MPAHIASKSLYIRNGIVLLVLLAATVAFSFVEMGKLNLLVALAIACTKAVLVAMFFMHLRYERPLMRVFAIAGIVWWIIMFGLTSTDVYYRHWLGTGEPPVGRTE